MNRRAFLSWIGLGAVERLIPTPIKRFLSEKARRIDTTETFTFKLAPMKIKIYMIGFLHKPL